MINKIVVKIKGSKELQRLIKKRNVLTRALVKNLVAETALNIQRRAKKLVNVDTGRLRASIRPIFFPGGLQAEVFTDVEYAVKQEFNPNTGKPYMRPAAEIEQRRFNKKLKIILGK